MEYPMETVTLKKETAAVDNPGMSKHLPVGEMTFDSTGSLRIKFHKNYGSLEQIRATLQMLKRLDNFRFWIPNIERLEMQDNRLCLSYTQSQNHLIPFTSILETWQKNHQLNIPLFIPLAEFLVKCSLELKETGISAIPFSPLLLFNVTGFPNAWRVVVLPYPDNKISNWAQADPLNWQWVSADTVLEGKMPDEGFLCGAVLHYCLVGNSFPVLLPQQEKFRWLLKGRIGCLNSLNRKLSAALPSSFSDEKENLINLITNWLRPGNSIQSGIVSPQKNLEKLGKDFSSYRLATRWEYEGRPGIALDLLLTCADFSSPEEITWDVIARLKEKKGDLKGGLDARLKALKLGAPGAERNAIHFLRRIANGKLSMERFTFLEDAFSRVDKAFPKTAEEFHVMEIAHLEARYLQKNSGALKRLKKDFSDSWNQLLRIMLIARIFCLQKKYPSVSKHCKMGMEILNKLPHHGLNKGRYVLSYLQILDGIANFGAVGSLDVSYLKDAFAHFTRALDMAIDIKAEDLIKIGSHWLIFLEKSAVHFPPKISQTLTIGISSYISNKKKAGFYIPLNFEEIPSIPWYDEYLLFPDLSFE
jgi:hypothetical protein